MAKMAPLPHTIPPRAAGFTLVEMVVVILILAILATISAGILLTPFRLFEDQSRRTELVAEADLALTRMVRELRLALPNSVRIHSVDQQVEFIPSLAGGRYRAVPKPGAAVGAPEGKFLDFTSGDTGGEFQVLGPLLGEQEIIGRSLVIYNVEANDASPVSAYSGGNRRAITSFDSTAMLITWAGNPFPFPSLEAQRFDVVEGPVRFFCADGRLLRSSYAFDSFDPDDFSVLAENVTHCQFTYLPGNHIRNGVVSLQLTLTQEGESVTLLYQTQVLNAP